MDELLIYLYEHFSDTMVISGNEADLLVWGHRTKDDVVITGLSINLPIYKNSLSKNERCLYEVGKNISTSLGLPYLGIRYPQEIGQNEDAIVLVNKNKVLSKNVPAIIQKTLQTDYELDGTYKKINRGTSDAFHSWARLNLPSEYVRVDIDAILQNQSTHTPKFLLEIKRSTKVPPSQWSPYPSDARNYLIQLKLAQELQIPYLTLNHSKLNEEVVDDTQIGLYIIKGVTLNPLIIDHKKQLMSARDFISLLEQKDRLMEFVNNA